MTLTFTEARIQMDSGVWLCLKVNEPAPARTFILDKQNRIYDCEIKEHRAESTEKMKREASGEFYFTVVCENEGQKKAMLKALGVPHWEAFVHGSQLAGLLCV